MKTILSHINYNCIKRHKLSNEDAIDYIGISYTSLRHTYVSWPCTLTDYISQLLMLPVCYLLYDPLEQLTIKVRICRLIKMVYGLKYLTDVHRTV